MSLKHIPPSRPDKSTPNREPRDWSKLLRFRMGPERVSNKELMYFTRKFSTMITSGMSISSSLHWFCKGEKNPKLVHTIQDMIESIQSGSTLTQAVEGHPKVFNRLYANMIYAGEQSGSLDTVLNRLAVFMEKSQKIKDKIKAAMTYPVIVFGMALAILTFLMTFVVPKFEAIFADLMQGRSLPALTEFTIGVSRSMGAHAVPLTIGLVFAGAGLHYMRSRPRGRYLLDRIKLHLPIFGNLVRKSAVARFTRTLGTLLASGVEILPALTIVRKTAGNAVLANAIADIHDSVKEGGDITEVAESTGVFPPPMIGMLGVGEQTSKLPEMLNYIADDYESEVDDAVASLTSVLEPILIVFLALVVGTIVVALFLPLVTILDGLVVAR